MLTNNKPELAKELLGMLAAELPEVRNSINAAHQEQNYTLLEDLVHKLHGSCCYTGVTRLKTLSADLEDALQLKHYDIVKEMIKQLNLEIETILNYIDNENYIHE